jgi:predicted hotdog family 3-hydroxylacyl-ACP dehydratase
MTENGSLDVDAIDAIELVPHRSTMLWLDKVVHVDTESVAALAQITESNFLLRDACLPVWTGVEFMAQTIAAWSGYQAKNTGRPVAIGFLLGTRRFEAHCQQFKLGETLRIEARMELLAENGLAMFDCRIVVNNQSVATAKLSVYEPADVFGFLQNIKGEI